MKYKFPDYKRHSEVYRLNPELRLVPEFVDLGGRRMCFVILANDIDSPFRYLLKEEGREEYRIACAKALGLQTPATGALSQDGKKLVKQDIPQVRMAEEVYQKMMGGSVLEALQELKENMISFLKNKNGEDPEKWMSVCRALVKDNTLLQLDKQIEELKESVSNPKSNTEEETEEKEIPKENTGEAQPFDFVAEMRKKQGVS